MKKIKIKWNSERLLSLTAMTLSFITLVIFIYQTNLMSKQNYLSILPYLNISSTLDNENNIFELNISNHGVGPAIIESVRLDYKGKEYKLEDYNDNIFEFLKSESSLFDSIQGISTSTLEKGLAIPINSTYNVIRTSNALKDYQVITNGFNNIIREGLVCKIVYKSIQDEKWLIHNDSSGPKKLD